jgi:hypothetical protein
MNAPPLEDRLNHLADRLAAPATPEAREAIGRRASVLRRRRRVRTAVGSGALAVVVAGMLTLRGGEIADVETTPAGPPTGSLPVLTLELDSWRIVTAEDTTTTGHIAAIPDVDVPDPVSGSLQVFRRPGDLTGPSVFLHHRVASDPIVPEPGAVPVTIAGSEGYLRETGKQSMTLRWSPPLGDNAAYLEARGLSQVQVMEFAMGLEARDDAIHHPPTPDEQFGFDATELPAGIEEVPVDQANPGQPVLRRAVFERDSATVEVTIDDRGDAAFEAYLGNLLMADGDAEQVSVMDHAAVLVERPDETGCWLVWQQTDEATVVMSLTGVARSTVDDVVDGLREVSERDWQDLLAAHADAATGP